ncbi:MAG: DEAD/DEAH box helicase family protein, partial [Rickettsiales bacterium]|nr:DEAD/DEAH box helicase family protein [Rickettsiales bacterium]
SIALVGQTLREWTTDATYSIYPICVCSDAEISKKFIHNEDDTSQFDVENLAYPASTNPKEIIFRLNLIEKNHPNKLCVIFSTYQSIERVAEAISKSKRTIDLIICDEAHRTTGVTLAGENESHFVKVHDQKFLPAKKRLYMTATPKIYGDNAKKTAETHSVKLCSMDDPGLYGEEV